MTHEEKKSLINIGLNTNFELLKSFDVFEVPNSTREEIRPIVPTITPFPDGGKFLVKRNIQLKPGDNVVVGLASTPGVDLVNDAILDIAYTFGDYIEDFLETGRVFYEHGYKLIGKTDPNDMYDVPLGVPIAVQFNTQKLYVWILLDMQHPLARKVYSILSNQDERISYTLGLSIGAIPIGKGRTEYVDGKAVNVPPKMRLYEVSFTGQPINTETWAKIVKSLLYNFEEEDSSMKKIEKNIKLKAGEQLMMDDKDKEQNSLDDMLGAPEGDVGGEMGAAQSELVSKEEKSQGDQEDTNMLSDLLSGDEEKPEGEEQEVESTETFSNDLVLDKLDMLSERLEKLEDMLSKVSEMEAEEAARENPQVNLMEETKNMKATIEKVTKSLDSINDNLEIFSSVVKSLKDELFTQKEELKSLFNQKVSEVQETVTKSLSVKEAQTPVNKPVLGVGKTHPNLGNVEEANNIEFELKVKSLISDKSKLLKLKSMYDSYKKFKGSPVEIKNFEDKMYESAQKEFNLTEVELKKIFKEFRSKDK